MIHERQIVLFRFPQTDQIGASGEIETQRLTRIKTRLADWLKGSKNKEL